MARGHGGARRNAGRKKSEGQLLLRQLMDEAIGAECWQRMLERVVDKIEKSGDAGAFYRFASLRYGLPAQMIEPDSDPEPLKIREVVIMLHKSPDPNPDADDDDGVSQLPPADVAPALTEPADDDEHHSDS